MSTASKVERQKCRAPFDDVVGEFDALLTAPARGEAPVGLNSTGDASLCAIWTTLHVPAVMIPVFKGPNGLPVGAQLIARRNDDRQLLAVSQWAYERLA